MVNNFVQSEWRKIPSFPGYEITSRGDIRKIKSGVMHSIQDVDRVTTVMLTKDGKRYHRSLGALVKETFPNVVW